MPVYSMAHVCLCDFEWAGMVNRPVMVRIQNDRREQSLRQI